jgi:hypothetical protein
LIHSDSIVSLCYVVQMVDFLAAISDESDDRQ